MACKISMTADSKTTLTRLIDNFTKISSGNIQGTKIGQFLQDLAVLAQVEAEKLFSMAVAAVAGTPDEKEMPQVDMCKWTDDGKAVQFTARGKDVLFLEFGTGLVNFGESTRSENYPSDSKFSVYQFLPGSYSLAHGEFLTDPKKLNGLQGRWPVPGRSGADKFASGSNPAKAMYGAEKYIHEHIQEIADEVFGHD